MTVWFILCLVDSFGWLNDSLIVCLFLSRLSLVHCDLVLLFLFVIYLHQKLKTRWWFQLWFPTQGNDPIWRAYFFQMGWFNHQLENYKNPCCLRFCASVTTTFMLFFCSDRCDPDKVLLSYTCRRLVDLPGATPPKLPIPLWRNLYHATRNPKKIWNGIPIPKTDSYGSCVWEIYGNGILSHFFLGGSDPNSPERFWSSSLHNCLSFGPFSVVQKWLTWRIFFVGWGWVSSPTMGLVI